jgi:hypothetical protein
MFSCYGEISDFCSWCSPPFCCVPSFAVDRFHFIFRRRSDLSFPARAHRQGLTFFAASFFPRLICRSRFSVFALPVTIFFLGSDSVLAAAFHWEQASLLVNRAKVLLCSFFWLPSLFSLGFGSLLVLSHRRRQDKRLGPRLRFRSPRR